MLTPQQGAAKWAANTSNAMQAFKDGVNSVTVSPMAKAAQALDRYLSGVQQAVSSGKMAAALNAGTVDTWKQAMLTKGAARISGGVQAATPKMVAFNTVWYPYEQALSDRIAGMPKGSVADSQARSNYAIAYNAAFSKRLPGS
jgi:glycerol kinase